MESLPYNLAIKNRSHRSENIWTAPAVQAFPSFTINNTSAAKNSQTAFIFAYLLLEKNLKVLAQNIRKLLAKQKRFAFRKVLDFSVRTRGEKGVQPTISALQGARGKREYEKTPAQCVNPEGSGRQLQTVCQRNVDLALQRLVRVLDSHRTQSLLRGLAGLQHSQPGLGGGGEFANGYLQSKGGNNGSRISNKRKSTRTGKGEQVKENSHCNGSEFSLENQRLRNQLLGEDFEREQFTEKMQELLEQHEKYLLQGSATTRGNGKKNR